MTLPIVTSEIIRSKTLSMLTFALIGVGHILDTHFIGTGSVMRTAIIFFYLSNEGVSLLENAAAPLNCSAKTMFCVPEVLVQTFLPIR